MKIILSLCLMVCSFLTGAVQAKADTLKSYNCILSQISDAASKQLLAQKISIGTHDRADANGDGDCELIQLMPDGTIRLGLSHGSKPASIVFSPSLVFKITSSALSSANDFGPRIIIQTWLPKSESLIEADVTAPNDSQISAQVKDKLIICTKE